MKGESKCVSPRPLLELYQGRGRWPNPTTFNSVYFWPRIFITFLFSARAYIELEPNYSHKAHTCESIAFLFSFCRFGLLAYSLCDVVVCSPNLPYTVYTYSARSMYHIHCIAHLCKYQCGAHTVCHSLFTYFHTCVLYVSNAKTVLPAAFVNIGFDGCRFQVVLGELVFRVLAW